jgi:hypothetical protein
MSDRRRFLKGLTSLPLATVLANPRLAAAVSAGLQEVGAKLADGRTIKAALAKPLRILRITRNRASLTGLGYNHGPWQVPCS